MFLLGHYLQRSGLFLSQNGFRNRQTMVIEESLRSAQLKIVLARHATLPVFLTIFLYSLKVQIDSLDGTATHIAIALMRPLGIVSCDPLVEVSL